MENTSVWIHFLVLTTNNDTEAYMLSSEAKHEVRRVVCLFTISHAAENQQIIFKNISEFEMAKIGLNQSAWVKGKSYNSSTHAKRKRKRKPHSFLPYLFSIIWWKRNLFLNCLLKKIISVKFSQVGYGVVLMKQTIGCMNVFHSKLSHHQSVALLGLSEFN